jgi:hypothetical protein
MTVINGIEIDHVRCIRNPMKDAIHQNDPLEDQLHVVAVVSNPCQYARRYILAKEFIHRMELEPHVLLYVVELCFEDQSFCVTKAGHPRHLQLRTSTQPLWHKENMINVGIQTLLPKDWKAVAWIDADLEFESASWASDTLKILNGCSDIVQLFSHCSDMDKHEQPMQLFQSFGFQYCKKKTYGGVGLHFWHPGFAWAMTRKAYDKVGGLYEKSILGSGDHNMALSLIGNGARSINERTTDAYKKSVELYQTKQQPLRLGYVPGVIRHYFHGSKQNRKYKERWQILVKHQYNPYKHITHDEHGLIIPSKQCPPGLLEEITQYFRERNEDEGYT